MKILFLHRWVGVHGGGTETHIKELALQLANRGHKVDILTREGKELRNVLQEVSVWRVSKNWRESEHSYNGIRVYIHTFLFMVKSLLKIICLRLIRGIRYDVISVHFVTEAEVARIYRLLFGVPYVFVLEGYTPLEGKRAALADKQIVISMHEYDECIKHHKYKPSYIPKGLDTSRFNMTVDGSIIRKKFCSQNENMVLTVCRIEPRKDLFTLIFAAEIVCSRNHNAKFIIVGEGIDSSKIKNEIIRRRLSDKIIMAGPVEYFSPDLPEYYRAADIFVLPTLYEGFGYVYCEAMACGLPVVSTTTGAVPEVVGDAGVLIAPGDPDLLSEKILELLENSELRQDLSLKGLERVKKYGWDRLAPEYETVYSSVARKV